MGKRSAKDATPSLFDLPEEVVTKVEEATASRRCEPSASYAVSPPRTIQQRFDDWIVRHPEIETLSVQFARELRQAGHSKYGIKAVLERIRWHYATRTDQAEEFKISNSYTSRMARFLMTKYPELEGFFNLRELRQE